MASQHTSFSTRAAAPARRRTRAIAAPALLALAVALGACSTTSPDVVSPHEAQRMSQVLDGTVISVRPVVVEGRQSGAGGVAGGLVGGIAGSGVGGYRDSAVGAVLGAVAGAMIGNAMERYGTREEAVEVLVQLRNGERRSIVQARGQEAFGVGDPVLIVTTGGRTRVTRAPQVRG